MWKGKPQGSYNHDAVCSQYRTACAASASVLLAGYTDRCRNNARTWGIPSLDLGSTNLRSAWDTAVVMTTQSMRWWCARNVLATHSVAFLSSPSECLAGSACQTPRFTTRVPLPHMHRPPPNAPLHTNCSTSRKENQAPSHTYKAKAKSGTPAHQQTACGLHRSS